MTAQPDESTVERPDCGVCGVPADAMVEVTHDGAMVPRCAAHVEERPYQAEARLSEAQARADRLTGALPNDDERAHLHSVWEATVVRAQNVERDRRNSGGRHPPEFIVKALYDDARLLRTLLDRAADALLPQPVCTCHVSDPDGFGNRDQIENPDCPTCGSAT